MQHQTLQPVAMQERIQTIDIIRGIALLGILIINFTVDNGASPQVGWTGFGDQLSYWTIKLLLDDRFMATYCFLFGLGFSIQMLRAEARNSPFVFVYMRRLIVLYLIGVIQNIFIGGGILVPYAMVGVILLLLHKLPMKFLPVLALLCFLAPWARNSIKLSERQKTLQEKQKPANNVTVDTTIIDAYTGVYERELQPGRYNIITRKGDKVYSEGLGGKFRLYPQSQTEFLFGANNEDIYAFRPDSTGPLKKLVITRGDGVNLIGRKIQMDIQQAEKETDMRRKGVVKKQNRITYKQFVVKNANSFWQRLKSWSWADYFWGGDISGILPLFLMGLYFGKRKIFYDISSNRHFLRKVMWWGLSVGGIGIIINLGFEAWNFINDISPSTYPAITNSLIYLSLRLGVMIMALAYVAGLALLIEKIDWKKRLSFLIPIGRMGLTNYLLHAIAYTIIFESFGLNLSGKVGSFYGLLLAIPVAFLIYFISRWWFKHFRIGPAEWLWRSLTYLKFQPMRLKPDDKKEVT